MPELSYENMLRCLSDTVTQVRDMDGRLLGCIPRVADDHPAPYVSTARGQNFELMVSAQVVVRCDPRTHNPTDLPGFIPLDNTNFDAGQPIGGLVSGEDPDIGRPV